MAENAEDVPAQHQHELQALDPDVSHALVGIQSRGEGPGYVVKARRHGHRKLGVVTAMFAVGGLRPCTTKSWACMLAGPTSCLRARQQYPVCSFGQSGEGRGTHERQRIKWTGQVGNIHFLHLEVHVECSNLCRRFYVRDAHLPPASTQA